MLDRSKVKLTEIPAMSILRVVCVCVRARAQYRGFKLIIETTLEWFRGEGGSARSYDGFTRMKKEENYDYSNDMIPVKTTSLYDQTLIISKGCWFGARGARLRPYAG